MLTTLFACFGTVVGLIGAVMLVVYVVVPVIGHVFTFFGRFVRFVYQEIRDIILLPIALFVCVVKLFRAAICVVLARWDIVGPEVTSAKLRMAEAGSRLVSVFIDNPLRVFAIDSPKQAVATRIKPTVEPKNQFAGYKIIGTLPSGGSGARIYIAQHTNKQNTVVIKSFNIKTGSELPQIVRESRSMEAAKKLGLVIEHHLDNERFWYAMPYLSGNHLGLATEGLHNNSGGVSEKQLKTMLSYQQNLLCTLREYHTAGLWHKDVKPDNIIIHGGRAHLVDLGLVTPLASAMTLTTHGTEYFRDPEMVRQAMRGVKVHQVDGSKFDVYGAGAVLYFMLENTFPAHGGLSDFSKESPECIRWIVRRAMADYDKRYKSIDEMLADVETLLGAHNIFGVRPADLPSMGGSHKNQKQYARRLPAKSTPSTGGGPFPKTINKTKPFGLFVLLTLIVVGAVVVRQLTRSIPEVTTTEEKALQIQDYPVPIGRILVLNDTSTLHNEEMRLLASNSISQLGVIGWDIFVDSDKEARVRSWLPADLNTSGVDLTKLENENLAGILLITDGIENVPSMCLIDQNGVHTLQ
ncbi:MAG: hypothetical protein QF718_07650 [Phycisphaerales bacterium]|jgi:serine/threonine protein kinase|nr:hypothetical protein [Phycisphaerales bacterium]